MGGGGGGRRGGGGWGERGKSPGDNTCLYMTKQNRLAVTFSGKSHFQARRILYNFGAYHTTSEDDRREERS